jgi:GGDEF domain-containing protein
VADSNSLQVPVGAPLDELSQLITGQERGVESGDNRVFLLTDDQGRYKGVGFLLDLLRTMTDLKIQHARHANPLTQLPGNVPINRQLDRLLEEDDQGFVVVYADLDHFKPYNDEYGYARGDDVLVSVSRLFSNHLSRSSDFIGHIGGDDFMFVMHGDDWEERCERILEEFASLAPWFYSAADRTAGGHWAVDRRGNRLFFPLISLSMAALPVPPRHGYASHQVLSGILSELKRQAKKTAGNSLFVDRRDARKAHDPKRVVGDTG